MSAVSCRQQVNMAGVGIPSITQLSAGHSVVYEGYFRQADASNSGKVTASDAATFLKKSNLKERILHQIWELSDPQSTGFLDKQRFFLALRLIALAQNGKDVSLNNVSLLVPAPNLGDIPPPSVPPPLESSTWSVKPAEKIKYDGIFEGLNPVNGLLPGDKVKTVLVNSNLPIDVLGRVWELSDIDKDGMLDNEEFAVAMHLVYRALEGDPVPLALPHKMMPLSKRKLKHGSPVAPSSPALQIGMPSPITSVPVSGSPVLTPKEVHWVVPAADRLKYDTMFKTADKDVDGLVSGEEIKNIFIASGLPQPVLAHIWGLSDTKNTGRLNIEQFSLAMYLIQKKINGVEPPNALTPDMVPPSMRSETAEDNRDGSTVASTAGDFSSIKELDKINRDIEELGREKRSLQQELEGKEDSIRQRNSEIQNLQVEFEKTKKSVKELEVQKNEAQIQLDELDNEKTKYESQLKEVRQKCEEETNAITNLKSLVASGHQSVMKQEEELSNARDELNKLRQEETQLEKEMHSSKEYSETVQKQIRNVEKEINQVKSKLAGLNETHNGLNSTISQYNSLMNSNSVSTTASGSAIPISDFPPLTDGFGDLVTPTPSEADTMSIRATAGSSPVSSISGFSVGSGRVDEAVDDFKDNDPFKSKDAFSSSETVESGDPFHADDPFKSDPFNYKSVSFADAFTGDPFEADEDLFKNDPFKSDLPAGAEANGTRNGLSSSSSKPDPFASMDPFQASFPSTTKPSGDNFFSSDPFKPSGSSDTKRTTNSQQKNPSLNKDPFNDPFGGEPF